MANISKINGIARASIGKLNSRTLVNNDEVMGIINIAAGTPTTYLTKQSQWADGASDGSSGNHGLAKHPTNWESLHNTHIVYGSTAVTRAWSSDAGTVTPSSTTGPSDGHDENQGIDGDGREGSRGNDYMFTEVSSQFNKRFLLRTPELDFTDALSNNSLKLYFWFHMYGSNIGNLGVAATDSSTSAGDDTLGKHFTSDTEGGLTITYWDDNSDDGSSTASGVRITGQQQTAGHGSTSANAHWRLASVDLNDLAGQASVYLWFYSKSTSSYRGDVCIDDVSVVGQE